MPLQAIKSLVKGATEVVTETVKQLDIIDEMSGVDPFNKIFGDGKNRAAIDRPLYKIAQFIDDKIKNDLADDPRLKDALLLTEIPKTFGQLGVQMLAGYVTGGALAPTLLGMAQGATGQYEEASKAGANEKQRAIANIVGGLLAAPDALLFGKWFKTASILKQKSFLGNFSRTIYRGLRAKGIVGAEAELLSKSVTQGFVRRLGAKAVERTKSGVFEVAQETTENHANYLTVYLTYDHTPERLKKAITFGGKEDIETAIISFFAGGGG